MKEFDVSVNKEDCSRSDDFNYKCPFYEPFVEQRFINSNTSEVVYGCKIYGWPIKDVRCNCKLKNFTLRFEE
jgi:hypothetical protein